MRKLLYSFTLLLCMFCFSCKQDYVPKPRGFFRIEFQKKTYHGLQSSTFPYRFEIPDYSLVVPDDDRQAEPFWINLEIPKHKAEIHISYKKVENNLIKLIESSRKLAYDHSFKADAIDERVFINAGKRVYGTIYRLEGNTASSLQFYLTDSTKNFLRGALYIREVPNIDSIRPVIDYLIPDVIHLIETTEWVN